MNCKSFLLTIVLTLFLASCSKTEVTEGADSTPDGKSCVERPGSGIQLDTAWVGDTTINF